MEFFEGLTSIVDAFADAWGQANQNIASFLADKFGMIGGTEKIPLSFSSEVNGAAILEISYTLLFERHFPFAVHGQIGLAVNITAFEAIELCLFGSGIAGDDRLSFEIFDDEAEDIFCIINGIPTHGFDHKGESILCFLQHGNSLMDFTDVGWMSNFPERQLLLGIGHDVIPVAPEVLDLFFERLGEMDQEAQPSIGVSFWSSGFIKAVFGSRGLEVILPHLRQDRTGVHDKMFPGNNLFSQKHLDQLYANGLQS